MNLETKITIYKFTPQLFTLTQNSKTLLVRCHCIDYNDKFFFM